MPLQGPPLVKTYTRVKVISMGDGEVGKSCLIKRFCESKFVPRYISTIGVDFGVRQLVLDKHNLKVNFWDLSGHPEFFEVRNEFYPQTQGIILVYDVTKAASFRNLESWVKEYTQYGNNSSFVTAVCANKVDEKKARVISTSQGQQWATSKGFKYFETSAKSGLNVNEMFTTVFQTILTGTRREIS